MDQHAQEHNRLKDQMIQNYLGDGRADWRPIYRDAKKSLELVNLHKAYGEAWEQVNVDGLEIASGAHRHSKVEITYQGTLVFSCSGEREPSVYRPGRWQEIVADVAIELAEAQHDTEIAQLHRSFSPFPEVNTPWQQSEKIDWTTAPPLSHTKLDLKNPGPLGLETLRALLAQQEDTSHHIIWVDRDGFARIDVCPVEVGPREWANQQGPQVRFRFGMLAERTGYVGVEASKDRAWVIKLYQSLKKHWEDGSTGHIGIDD